MILRERKSRENNNSIEDGNNREVREWCSCVLSRSTIQHGKSMTSTFQKNKEAIKAADVAKGVTIVRSKQRSQIMDEVEKMLLIWIKELDGDSISEGVICEKPLRICADLLKDTPSTSAEGESGFTLKASRGRIKKFNHQSGIHSVVRQGEAASSNKETAKKYVGEFHDLVNAGGYLPKQVFNCLKTGLFPK